MNATATHTAPFRAWIGCLASYNAGRLIGDWFDVSTEADDNAANIAATLAKGAPGAEEYFIADYEGPSAVVRLLGEYASAQDLATVATFLWSGEGLGVDAQTIAGIYIDQASPQRVADLDGVDLADFWSDHFAGEGDTLKDWCETYLDDVGFFEDVAEDHPLRQYFDFEAYASDMRLSGDVFTVDNPDGGLLVIWNR